MSAKAITEYTGKQLLYKHLHTVKIQPLVSVESSTNLEALPSSHPWLLSEKLVVKVDQLIKRRGKLGLIAVNIDWNGAKEWITERRNKMHNVAGISGRIDRFLIEPCVPHSAEGYFSIISVRSGDKIIYHPSGGVNISDDFEQTASSVVVSIQDPVLKEDHLQVLLEKVSSHDKLLLGPFLTELYDAFVKLHFTLLEVNPIVCTGGHVYMLDLAAKLDQTAEYLCSSLWGPIAFPPSFGRDSYPEEDFIRDLDARSGSSLKLTILNPNGKIWTMVAGGGASVIYADTICDLGGSSELANYGEYSGAPSEGQTYEYARTILSLMTKGEPFPQGKVLIIGGGIANFTNVAATFKGIIKALREYKTALFLHKVTIFVRRGGPNYQEGLRVMREVGGELGLPMHVFGTETHMTSIVSMALGSSEIPKHAPPSDATANFLLGAAQRSSSECRTRSSSVVLPPESRMNRSDLPSYQLFDSKSRAIIWGMQTRAVQGMLDFDYICGRRKPSVAAMTYPFSGDHKQRFYWGHDEVLVPLYKKMKDAFTKHSDADTLINFASLRSAYDSTLEAMQYPQIRTIAIIAEGIPERLTRQLIAKADDKGIRLIGPATVGGIVAGQFKIGFTAGMMDNVVSSRLYRAGSVAYVSRSGGMSNELNNIISRNADGVYEGVAIGGDRYPGSTFIDHLIRYEANPSIKMMVLLGEVGGVEEYEVCRMKEAGELTKPIIAWCIGTCSTMFKGDVQFGHAGASAASTLETSKAKNEALMKAGCQVPSSFDSLGCTIKSVFDSLRANGVIEDREEMPPPTVPMDYQWARELGLIRKPASFMSSICDERGEELLYAGVPISNIIQGDLGIGGVLGLLWFQRRLPTYAAKFLEMCLMVTADHGPAVSGAHNTIVCSRAGKDLVSSLTSGLLTIGERFGGALDGAAQQFSEAFDKGMTPNEFVNNMRQKGQLIMGIGHRVKSINNPDRRVDIIKEFVLNNFPETPLLSYALQVEKITTCKKPNLILNVDGVIAVSFVDLLRNSGLFTAEEAQEMIEIGSLNGLFVLGRSIGFIGHYLDQRRLKQGLYRHPWDDITYVMPENQMN